MMAGLERALPILRLGHPLWICSVRPFFLFASLGAIVFIGLWAAFLLFDLPLPAVPGGHNAWHAHELIFGMAIAAIAGFTLTVIPEFTSSELFSRAAWRRLAGLWLLGRLGFWSSGMLGAPALAVAGLAHLGFIGGLLFLFAPRIWRDPERLHAAFLWTLGALFLCCAGFYAAALLGGNPIRWLHAALGALMILIVVALSRISMRVVNAAIREHYKDRPGGAPVEYRARPPRRNLLIFCIALYTLAELAAPGSRLSGWLALAASAAVLNLMNDWHFGPALFRRMPFILYCVYVLMGAGYGVMGLALVLGQGFFTAGLHLLTAGAMGLAIFNVLCIAGRQHCGLTLSSAGWMPWGVALVILGALLRSATAFPALPASWLYGLAALSWAAAFLVYAWHMVPVFLRPRADGAADCDGVQSNSPFAKPSRPKPAANG